MFLLLNKTTEFKAFSNGGWNLSIIPRPQMVAVANVIGRNQ